VLATLMRWNSLPSWRRWRWARWSTTPRPCGRWGTGWLGVALDPHTTMRFPLYLTLLTALGAWWAALGMTEPGHERRLFQRPVATAGQALRATLDAGRWILATPFAWVVIAGGMLFDHLCRCS